MQVYLLNSTCEEIIFQNSNLLSSVNTYVHKYSFEWNCGVKEDKSFNGRIDLCKLN